ncbi:MAG: tetratricopeptide repeat protein [Planctomycetota bacterium]|nr:tetratricopeptide repeat protein [Planctomycetota bacterium]
MKKNTLCLAVAFVLITTCVGFPQQPQSNSLLALYQSARRAYTDRNFQKSAEQFHAVAEQCPGTELAIQCEYFAVMSEWATDPCDGCASKLSSWLAKAKKFQDEAIATGRSFDAKQLFKWTDNAELVHAKWDRQKQRFELAEQRLKKHLGFGKVNAVEGAESTSSKTNPIAWMELGSLMLEQRQDYAGARTCFDKAVQGTKESESTHCQALMGCAVTCWYDKQYAEARAFLDRLSDQKLDDDLTLQSQLLKVKVAKALGETVDVVETLSPLIRIALASNPPAATLYELAMALIESGDKSNSNEILLQLVHRFPESPISIEARVRLAQNATEKKAWKEAADWSGQALDMGCNKELHPYACWIRGQARFELGAFEDAKADLEAAVSNPSGNIQLDVSVRFQLAETLYHLQRWPEADTQWKWLIQLADASDANDASNEGNASKPEWYSVVLLRTAELLALRKEWDDAEKIVLRIRNDFPKCNRACEVDYLLARCLLSKADFDAARQALTSITQRTRPTSDELAARGHWMTGETYLMQRRYSDALAAYREVLQLPKQEYWICASLMQIAECCEALRDPQGSKDAYETIINNYSQSPFVSIAKERLDKIKSISVANQPPNVPSGTKR